MNIYEFSSCTVATNDFDPKASYGYMNKHPSALMIVIIPARERGRWVLGCSASGGPRHQPASSRSCVYRHVMCTDIGMCMAMQIYMDIDMGMHTFLHACLHTCLHTYPDNGTRMSTRVSPHIFPYTCLCPCPYTRQYTGPMARDISTHGYIDTCQCI